ncbi:MAG: molybdopterin molybdotransferase MoeA [Desulfovibrio sp.]|nr:molybdopterin molybdotransferase MoeA [Desulfovibrio sp.]
MKPFLNLKSVDEVLALIHGATPLGRDVVALADSPGRRLASPFIAPAALPGFVRSRMDGYAVRAADVFGASESAPALLAVSGDCQIGVPPQLNLGAGEAASIVTGAALPAGADSVVMIEDSRDAGTSQIEIIRSVAPGENIVESDEDAKPGQLLIPAGRRIRAQEAGIFAAFGIQKIEVYQQPRVAIIATGDEIVPIDTIPSACRLRDVNSWSLAAYCRLHGGLPLQMGIVPDERPQLEARLKEAHSKADIIAVSGGSSAGMRDHTAEAFLSLPDAKLLAHGVAMRPGKPFILAIAGGKYLFGLPGHVTSALLCAHVFLGPLLARLQGQDQPEPKPWIAARLSRSIASAQGRRDYIRCRLEEDSDGFVAQPVRSPSAVLESMLAADGLVICPENSEGLVKGQQVKFYPLR